jgi:hypothetical protein
MRATHRIAAAAALLLAATAPRAHHAFSPVYDERRMMAVTGIVTSFRLVNPHTMLTLDVAGDAGEVARWTVEFDGLLNLTVFGWTPETIRVGERVTVTGHPTHTGSPRLFFAFLERPDGTQLRRPGIARFDAIEQERRQRAMQRSGAGAEASE